MFASHNASVPSALTSRSSARDVDDAPSTGASRRAQNWTRWPSAVVVKYGLIVKPAAMSAWVAVSVEPAPVWAYCSKKCWPRDVPMSRTAPGSGSAPVGLRRMIGRLGCNRPRMAIYQTDRMEAPRGTTGGRGGPPTASGNSPNRNPDDEDATLHVPVIDPVAPCVVCASVAHAQAAAVGSPERFV